MKPLAAYVAGIGLIGPGLPDWPGAARVLRGQASWQEAPTVLPAPAALPPAERRRACTVVRLALGAGLEACARAQIPAAGLPAVFTSSGGDGVNCHEICSTLASTERLISPTRFHNSVHNAAAGYWSIATGATAPSTALCAFDGSFAAGLLEALAQLADSAGPVLLVSYEAPYPEPLRAARPLPHAFAVALVLSPAAPGADAACIAATLKPARVSRLTLPDLEALRAAVPAARSLTLLASLAQGGTHEVVLDYLDELQLAVAVNA